MTGQRAPRPLPLPRPPPRRPRPRLPAPGRESAAGRPDPPKGPEAGAPGFQGPGEGPPAARWPQVQSIDTAPRGEGAPSFSRAWPPGRSGPRPSLASDPAPGRGAARGPCSPEGGFGRWKERPVGGRVGRRGRPRSRSGNQVAGAAFSKETPSPNTFSVLRTTQIQLSSQDVDFSTETHQVQASFFT
ncbi:basic proline-rich protein-like isoform X3 [Equus quagga]|uniref:basic proline-rich protein-like isoform X3 n=1 Tax=Equus quagga TaxID=89248 RepID=UPI001EE1BF8D|nr:basic proline-rich protein-like isoform X3 [Equus quagga]XP_046530275.1 basic proline-rich protein-like isoform X3 [Equus quagga]